MIENDLARVIWEKSFFIHQLYGPGLLEHVYETLLAYELEQAGYFVERQRWIALSHEGLHIPDAYRADIIVDETVLVEIKSVQDLPKSAYKTVVTYLKLADLRLGLLINFSSPLLKDGFKRVVNGLQ